VKGGGGGRGLRLRVLRAKPDSFLLQGASRKQARRARYGFFRRKIFFFFLSLLNKIEFKI
jgi:hypothetical protein